jgi:diguanylate cyclase (GGDEF)-like protein/PAS domain S-box-containing protein
MENTKSQSPSIDYLPAQFDAEFFGALFECLQDGVFAIENERFMLVNAALCELLDYSREELISMPFLKVVSGDYRQLVKERAFKRLKGEVLPDLYEIDLVTKGGRLIHAQIKVSTFKLNDNTQFNVGSVRDISEEKRVVQQLEKSEREFRRIVENLPDIFYRTDEHGRILLASPYSAEVMGYSLDEIIGKPLADFYARPEEREPTLRKIMAGKGDMVAVESCLRHKDGSIIWVATHAYGRFDEQGQFLGVEGIARNITDRKIMEERLRHMAIRDPLTQVFNRFGFEECLNAAVNRARRTATKVALLFFDLDRFKSINDAYGHDVGDQYLATFARRLEVGFREIDTVARLGGDEFVVLLENIQDEKMLYTLLERCITALSDDCVYDGLSLPFRYSYGIAQYPRDGSDIETLLKAADQAMYQDKQERFGKA